MELNQGAILAMVSSPAYDPNMFLSPAQNAGKINATLQDKRKPLLNRAIGDTYPPGSTFKIITAMSALMGHKIDSGTQFFCPGSFYLGRFRFSCWRKAGHGTMNLVHAIEQSCNVFFWHTGLKTGVELIAGYAKDLGLGEATGIDLLGEQKGLVPTPQWKRKETGESWYPGDTANLSIGQGTLLVTPIQMLRVIAAVATDGKVFQPFIVRKIDDVSTSSKIVRHVPLDPKALKLVKDGLEMVVASPRGTGQNSKIEGLKVAGKTGTAQAPRGDDHAWFVAYAPADHPQAAIVAFIEHGGHGGGRPAEIAQAIFERMNQEGNFI